MEKKKILAVGLIGLLMFAGLVIAGCDSPGCAGNGNCTVTIDQGVYGLYVDNDSPRSTCGSGATYSSDLGKYTGGCNVQNNIDNRSRTYGTHGCDC